LEQKACLTRSILDQGWGEFVRQLEDKKAWRGGWVLYVPAVYTSQTCSQCNHASPGNRKSQELFVCENCGHKANTDENAAMNIERVGQARIACEVSSAVMPPSAGTSRIAA